ncbi:MAG: amidohydrolase family protein [Chitinophagaceae bacterium]|nr:amidohydrolase family protein [Chitinophagaceae bacterium]
MYRKFSADHIFNGYGFRQQEVLITDTAGVIVDLVCEQEAGDHIEKLNGILCPGFINAHCHLELSHMKGLVPKHTGLVDFVLTVVNERHFEEAEILSAIEMAENEMLQNGIVAVGDICNNTLTIPQKRKGRLRYHNFIEAAGFIPSMAKARFEKSRSILEEYRGTINDQRSTVSPHAPYSVSPEMFALINVMPGNQLLTIHNQETAAENDFFEKGTGDLLRMYRQMGIDISFFKPSGKSSMQTWLPHFTKEQNMILVHNVFTSAADLSFSKLHAANCKLQTFFCLCPNANLYISNMLPDVNMLIQHSANMVLGTDSLASNDRLCILEEMKTLQHHFKELELSMLLQWATSNGSRALQMDNMLGSFEKGKKPGLVLIEGVEDLKLKKDAKAKRIF